MSSLHLITPGFRFNCLNKIATNLSTFYSKFNFKWHLIADKKQSIDVSKFDEYEKIKSKLYFYEIEAHHPFGFEQREYFTCNIANNYNSNEWAYFLDDDNLVTPDIFECWAKYINDVTTKFVLMSQLRYNDPNLRLYGLKGHNKLGAVDIGNFIFKIETLLNIKMSYNVRSHDGRVAEHIAENYPDYLKYEPGYMTTYNILTL